MIERPAPKAHQMRGMLIPALMAEIPRNPETLLWLSFTEETKLFKLVDGGMTYGFCGYYIKGDSFWMGSDYVLPEFRGQGHHYTMTKYRLLKGRATGCTWARARCNRQSLPNYLREGFEPVHETKHRVLVKMRLR